jgi:hypothetical protein
VTAADGDADTASDAGPSAVTPVRAEARSAALAIAVLCGICLALGFGLGFFAGRGW